jgi:hypothetical protein
VKSEKKPSRGFLDSVFYFKRLYSKKIEDITQSRQDTKAQRVFILFDAKTFRIFKLRFRFSLRLCASLAPPARAGVALSF